MRVAKIWASLAATLCACAFGLPARAQDGPVKIAVMADLSSAYSDIGGKGLVDAARMAVEDFGGSVLGQPISLISADGQNKADVSSALARDWFDQQGVDMITDLPTSATALAVSAIGRERKKIVIVTSAATSDLTGAACSPFTLHWTYDTYALANSTGRAVVERGGTSWFFISADYAFGQALERDTTAVIKRTGGTVLGSVRAPYNTADFSSYLLQAQSSGAKVIGLANGGADTINSVKQAAEFGIVRGGQKLAGMLLFLTDVHSIGLKLAQGLMLTSAFYWDLDDQTRAWSKRFYARNGRMPTMTQAGTYGAVTHYLKAVKAAGTKQSEAVMAEMRKLPVNDFMTRNGVVRQDGRVVRDMFLFQVKTPEESKSEWDLYTPLATVPGDQAFRPMSEGGCPLVQASPAK